LGPVTRVYAESATKNRNHPNPDNAIEGAAITLRFKSGTVGTFIINDNTPSPFFFESGTGENPSIPHTLRDCYRIFGTKATLSFPDLELYYYDTSSDTAGWFDQISEKKLPVDQNVIPFDEQVKHFVDVIKGNAEPMCTVEEGVSALRVVYAVTQSLEKGFPVNVS
jgi:predicted dehydrogenase